MPRRGDPETDKPDACLELHKQRNGDVQRMKLWLFFHRASQQFCTSSDRRPVALVDYSGVPTMGAVVNAVVVSS